MTASVQMSLVTRLIDLVSEVVSPGGAEDRDVDRDGRLATAALLVHVARVDGAIGGAERSGLASLLQGRFGLSAGAVERLVARADSLDREVDDITELIDMMGHSLDDLGKRDLVAMAYRVAVADGTVQEFEDDLVWRLGHLLGFGDPEIADMRERALGRDGSAVT
jgi:uncharacterized tellurite resistance protein B-like protein